MSSRFILVREQNEGGGGDGMTLPLLLAIAIGGGVLLFICLAYLLIALAGRRHRTRTRARPTTSRARLDLESEGGSIRTPSPRPRRLTKQKPDQEYADMAEIQGKPYRSLSSLILPRGKPFNVFGTPAEAAGGQHHLGHIRRNNSWIDEDAIHGPRVQNDGRRLSVRDSFILRTPTLPDLFGHKGDCEGQFQNDPTNYSIQQPCPASLPAQRGHAPRIPLPRTASYELAEKLAAAARGGVPPSPQGPQGPRPVPLQRLRHKTTESDLAEILRSTEERLQNGTPSNSRPATRQRAASASAGSSVKTQHASPTKSRSPVKAQSPIKPPSPTKRQSPARSQSPVKSQMLTHVGQALDANSQRARTPSPSKRAVVSMPVETPVHHKRNISQASAVSDADSLFGETTPEIEEHMLPTGLSSPSRRSDHDSPIKPLNSSVSLESPGSDASSSLSTLYSINEPEDDSKTGGIGQSEGLIRGRKPRGLVIDTQMCDPFMTPAPPEVPPRSPKRQTSSLPPLRRLTPPEEDIVKETVVYAPFHSRPASNSPVPRPLDVVKYGSVDDQSQAQSPNVMYQPDMAPSPETIRPKSVLSMKPVFLVSSTSAVSMKASPGTSPEDNNRPPIPNNRLTFGPKGSVIPPPLTLKPGQGSPNREAMVIGSPESVLRHRSSPTARAVRKAVDESVSSGPTSPTRRPLPSPDLSVGSKHGSPTPVRYKRRGMASPIRDRALSRQPQRRDNSTDHVPSNSDCPSIVLKPSNSPKRNSYHREFAVMGLQSTVAQLRRMNSQMSTFSTGSSLSDPDSPTLTNLRGGGFSPDRSNSRVSKIARQNYLSLGTSPNSNRNSRSSIRSARNSIAVLKGRPGANKHVDSLCVAVEEIEKERGSESLIRGPRPLHPTPRSAGRGRPRPKENVSTMDSSTPRSTHIDGADQKCRDIKTQAQQ